MTQIFTNHIGYDCQGTKKAVFKATEGKKPTEWQICRYADKAVVKKGLLNEIGEVTGWNNGYFYTIRFDDLKDEGIYYINVIEAESTHSSFPFSIAKNAAGAKCLNAGNYYFKAQRPTAEYDEVDKNLRFKGYREGHQDVRGGWYDATGDYGVHLSHLAHSNFFSPQQVGFSAYAFFKIHDLMEQGGYPYYTMLSRRMLDEGMYGAEFIMRMRSPSGTFFRSKCRDADAFAPIRESRCIGYNEIHSSSQIVQGSEMLKDTTISDESYEVSYRSGGGYAIATLAAAAGTSYPSQFTREEYLEAALSAYEYLEKNSLKYTLNNEENLIDDYCRLAALTEIYKTVGAYGYLRSAREVADRILAQYVPVDDNMGYFSVNNTKRPFFHAADEGMPVVNLINFYFIEQECERKEKILDILTRVMRHHVAITNETNNPFGYARIHCQGKDAKIKTQFFYPHDVETAPWWQGENARIASLSSAAYAFIPLCRDEKLSAQLLEYADDQINWLLGQNPYDSCMMEGVGRNTNPYFFENRLDFIHCPGGVVNGITSGLHDESAIEFITEPTAEIKDNWRWAEQWIPHCSWLMHALAQKEIL